MAVAIDGSEAVWGEITVPADRYQTKKLIDWASGSNGDGRLWVVEAAGGLGYLLSQQLVARGEQVVDMPAGLASRRGGDIEQIGCDLGACGDCVQGDVAGPSPASTARGT